MRDRSTCSFGTLYPLGGPFSLLIAAAYTFVGMDSVLHAPARIVPSPLRERASTEAVTSRWEWISAIGLTVIVAALHAVRMLHAGGLWRDEAGAARLAMMPTVREIFGLFQHEAFPLLFPVTVRTWMSMIGGGDAALRGFGLLVGLAMVGVLWWNARAWRTVPLLSLSLFSDFPFRF